MILLRLDPGTEPIILKQRITILGFITLILIGNKSTGNAKNRKIE